MNDLFPILVAEDDDDSVLLLKRALERGQVRNPIRFVGDGAEAIAYLEGQPPYSDRAKYPFPCVILLDLHMPRKTGFEVLEWLGDHEHFHIIPTLVLSCSGDERDVLRSYRLGANAFMVKPVKFSDLDSMVRTIKEFWRFAEKVDVTAWASVEKSGIA